MSTVVSPPNVARGNERIGLEDVVRAARHLARETRGLAESTAGVLERELAMALTVAESLRDKLVSPDALRQSRAHPLMARLRTDAHRAVELGMDALATGYVFGVDLVENFVDRPRAEVEIQRPAS
jgi:hypothetical protein